jgi:hypothetical protein
MSHHKRKGPKSTRRQEQRAAEEGDAVKFSDIEDEATRLARGAVSDDIFGLNLFFLWEPRRMCLGFPIVGASREQAAVSKDQAEGTQGLMLRLTGASLYMVLFEAWAAIPTIENDEDRAAWEEGCIAADRPMPAEHPDRFSVILATVVDSDGEHNWVQPFDEKTRQPLDGLIAGSGAWNEELEMHGRFRQPIPNSAERDEGLAQVLGAMYASGRAWPEA